MTEKIITIDEVLKDDKTGRLTPAVTTAITGNLLILLEDIMKDKGYSDYPEALRDVIFAGVHALHEKMIKRG